MMTERALEKHLADRSTVEPLLTSLEQAIEAKKQNVEAIAHIRKALAGRIEEMQQAKAMVDGIMARETTDCRRQTAAESAWSLTLNLQNVWEFFKQWVIPAVIMFVFLWAVMLALQSNSEKGSREMPRLIETANAFSSADSVGAICTPLDRAQENGDEADVEETKDENFQIAEMEEKVCSEAVDSAAVSSSNHQQTRRPLLRNLFL